VSKSVPSHPFVLKWIDFTTKPFKSVIIAQKSRGFRLKTIAILGPTASGKTALSIDLALKYNAVILSLDSLSIYREIDIASAKPTMKERSGVAHFGLDVLLPCEHFDVTMFFTLYHEAKAFADRHNQPLIIVGGTGFYLKSMMEGLSLRPNISLHVKTEVRRLLQNLPTAYALMCEKDMMYASKVASNDSYRIEKWLEIFIATNTIPSEYLLHAKQAPLLLDLPLFEIETPKEILIDRVKERTRGMLRSGLIDEIFGLEKRYARAPKCMKAIGIKEVLDYFDGLYNYTQLEEKIATHTLQLAKRQRTFNASQFPPHPKLERGTLQREIEKVLKEF
jgi:tRNA dimethylallyltransferase